jgi:hypothetical protein
LILSIAIVTVQVIVTCHITCCITLTGDD